jgi:hypothetical protein
MCSKGRPCSKVASLFQSGVLGTSPLSGANGSARLVRISARTHYELRTALRCSELVSGDVMSAVFAMSTTRPLDFRQAAIHTPHETAQAVSPVDLEPGSSGRVAGLGQQAAADRRDNESHLFAQGRQWKRLEFLLKPQHDHPVDGGEQ